MPHTRITETEEIIWEPLETVEMNFHQALSSPVTHISMHTDFKETCLVVMGVYHS